MNIDNMLSPILPKLCASCNSYRPTITDYDFPICQSCLSRMIPFSPQRRYVPLLSEPFSQDPHKDLILYVVFPYDEIFASLIKKIKFMRKAELARFLGSILGELVYAEGLKGDLIVPIPLSSERLRKRGFNQAYLLADRVSEINNIPVIPDVLLRVKDTKMQADLKDESKRASNVKDAFALNQDYSVDGLRILLIDDVATTGNTLHEAASVLLDNGASFVLSISLCGNRSVKNAEPY